MQCLVLVRFLPGGSLPPDEFFARLGAQWSWMDDADGGQPHTKRKRPAPQSGRPRAAVGITDYESVEQLAIDLSIMPGAGISNVEVVPVDEGTEVDDRATDIAVVGGRGEGV